jgi:2-methylcitrate dehydratase PrpD
MFDGDITNESFAPEKFGDPAVLTFMKKIKVSEDAGLTARGGGAVPTRVTAVLSDGERVVREVDHAPGFAGRPMQRADIDRKFRGNVGKHWPPSQTDSVLQALGARACGRFAFPSKSACSWEISSPRAVSSKRRAKGGLSQIRQNRPGAACQPLRALRALH